MGLMLEQRRTNKSVANNAWVWLGEERKAVAVMS